MWYKCGRVNPTRRVTPAIDVGVASHALAIEETVALLK